MHSNDYAKLLSRELAVKFQETQCTGSELRLGHIVMAIGEDDDVFVVSIGTADWLTRACLTAAGIRLWSTVSKLIAVDYTRQFTEQLVSAYSYYQDVYAQRQLLEIELGNLRTALLNIMKTWASKSSEPLWLSNPVIANPFGPVEIRQELRLLADEDEHELLGKLIKSIITREFDKHPNNELLSTQRIDIVFDSGGTLLIQWSVGRLGPLGVLLELIRGVYNDIAATAPGA